MLRQRLRRLAWNLQLVWRCFVYLASFTPAAVLWESTQRCPSTPGEYGRRKYQTGIENGVIAVELAGALWFGDDAKLGHAFWQDIDSTALSGLAAQLMNMVSAAPARIKAQIPMNGSKVVAAKVFRVGR